MPAALFKGSDVLLGQLGERIIGGRGAIRVQPKDYARQVRVVGRWSAELIVGLSRAERSD